MVSLGGRRGCIERRGSIRPWHSMRRRRFATSAELTGGGRWRRPIAWRIVFTRMSDPSATPSTPPLPVAVVGCGRMGRYHAKAYAAMPRVKLVGVFDASPDAARAAAEEFGCEAFTDI